MEGGKTQTGGQVPHPHQPADSLGEHQIEFSKDFSSHPPACEHGQGDSSAGTQQTNKQINKYISKYKQGIYAYL